jgi:hypothetical protein
MNPGSLVGVYVTGDPSAPATPMLRRWRHTTAFGAIAHSHQSRHGMRQAISARISEVVVASIE